MGEKKTIVVVEDDPGILNLMRLSLGSQGYRVMLADNGTSGLALFNSSHPDLLLVDLGLPDMDGRELIEAIRMYSETPIVVISARDQEAQKVAALDAGADDYVVKPFGIEELYARIRVALRHRAPLPSQEDPVFETGDLRIDEEHRMVSLRGESIHFTPIEYQMLLLLVHNRGKVLTHRYLQDEIWGYPASDEYQSLRVYMANIRRKLEDDASNPRYITTEVGVGYRFNDDGVR